VRRRFALFRDVKFTVFRANGTVSTLKPAFGPWTCEPNPLILQGLRLTPCEKFAVALSVFKDLRSSNQRRRGGHPNLAANKRRFRRIVEDGRIGWQVYHKLRKKRMIPRRTLDGAPPGNCVHERRASCGEMALR
jgi:hypothetical protein